METDYGKIKLNPLFEPIKKIFEFFILGIGFVTQKDFQNIFLQIQPSFAPFVDTFNKEVNLRVEAGSVKAEAGLYWVNIGRLMAISLFDILQFSKKYHNLVKNTEIFKFAKHIRNGAAHDNKFDLNPPIKNPICWGGRKTISQNLNDTKVFPDFISSSDLIILMSDISALIEEKLANQKRQHST